GTAGIRVVARALAADHHVDAVIAEDALELDDVGEPRHVLEDQRLVGEQARDHQGQRGVLGARDRDRPVQALAADNANPIHSRPARFAALSAVPRSMDPANPPAKPIIVAQLAMSFAGRIRRKSGPLYRLDPVSGSRGGRSGG